MRRAAGGLLLCAASVTAVSAAVAPASATDGPGAAWVSAATGSSQLTGEGPWTVTLMLTNLTATQLGLTATAFGTAPAGCSLTLAPPTLPVSAVPTTETVTVAKDCAAQTGFAFSLNQLVAGAPARTLPVTASAAAPAAADVHWSQLWVFLWSLAGALVVAVVALWKSYRTGAVTTATRRQLKRRASELEGKLADTVEASLSPDDRLHLSKQLQDTKAEIGALPRRSPRLGALPYLGTSWTFTDSWLSNITAAGGLLTGIIGSSGVATALLGADADDKLRLATVGAAIAVALLAAAPLVLGIFQPTTGEITIVGLGLAAAVSLAAAIGELWVMRVTAHQLGVGSGLTGSVFAVALIVVVAYAVVTLRATAVAGLAKPAPARSDTLLAADELAKVLQSAKTHAATLAHAPLSDELRAMAETQQHRLTEAAGPLQRIRNVESSQPVVSPRRRSALL